MVLGAAPGQSEYLTCPRTEEAAMDHNRFDVIAKTIGARVSRRTGIGLLLGGSLAGSLPAPRADAKKNKPCPPCKKRKKGKCTAKEPNGTPCSRGGLCRKGRCKPATCSDGFKNGGETDVDCGGMCPRCLTDKTCITRDDCDSSFCPPELGRCHGCAFDGNCEADADGFCFCTLRADGQKVCRKQQLGFGPVAACADCPVGMGCFIEPVTNLIYCFKPCGAG